MREILRLICDEGLSSKGEIANKLGIQESTLDGILSLLSSKGYLKTMDSTEEVMNVCIGCHMSKECMQKAAALSAHMITDKGKNYLEKLDRDSDSLLT